MTHEYTLLLGGTVITGGTGPDAAAIAWAADTVLALGTEMEVRSISRGDSHVVAIPGRFVVPLAPGADVAWPTDATLELGGPADLAVLDRDPRVAATDGAGMAGGRGSNGGGSPKPQVVAVVRAGRVEAGWPDPHTADAMKHRQVTVADGIDLAVDEWRPPVTDAPPSDGPTTDAPPSDGTTTDARSAAAPAFVLVHGLASNARLWDGVATALVAAGHRVFAVDLRGHGRSSKPAGPYDVPTVADDLATLIGHLGLERPVVAGQSWGGNVVLELATRRPDLVRGIVCVDGGWLEPSRDFADWDACRAALAPPRLAGRRMAEIEGYLRAAHPDWPETGLRGVLANFELRKDGTVAPWLTFDHHIKVLHGLWEHRPSELYAGLAVPVLLVPADSGESDRTRKKRGDVDTAATIIPDARVRWFTGDHDIHAQHPAELAGVMHDMTLDGFFA